MRANIQVDGARRRAEERVAAWRPDNMDIKPWEAMSRGERLVSMGDRAFAIICGEIHRDYTTFFKRHVLTRFPKAERPKLLESSILIALVSFTRPLTGAELSQALRATPSSVSRALTVLEEGGLITVKPCDHDSRALCNVLTDEGRARGDAILHYWSVAVQKAEMITGSRLDRETFVQQWEDINSIKDRAFAFREFKPGRLGVYVDGMSRPERRDRKCAMRAYPLRDSYLRFFNEAAHRDYLCCFKRRAMAPILKEAGMDMRGLWVLNCVDFYGVSLSQSEVAASTRMDSATVARATHTLAEAGLISLDSDEDDTRICLLSTTQAGRDLMSRYRERGARLVERVEHHYDLFAQPDEVKRLIASLKTMQDRAALFADLTKLPEADPVPLEVAA